MEGFPVPRFVFIIPFFALLTLGSFFWTSHRLTKSEGGTVVGEFKIPVPTPRLIKNPPLISAKSALVIERTSGVILFSKNPNLRFSPASATKIMTAFVTLLHYSPTEILTIDEEKIPGSTMWLAPGERITVLNLLYGLLLNSGNDAAFALAKNYPGGVEAFVREMNRVAKDSGLKNTHFVDPAGLSDEGNFTTTLDLANLTLLALKDPIFVRIVATKEETVFDQTQRRAHRLQNLNQLLWEVPGVKGVKTGFTERAGGVLVTFLEQQERQFLIVVFKSEDRFQDTKNLIEWVLQTMEEK